MSYLDFKEVTSENTGTSLRYGGNDLREIMKILNGKVVQDRRPKILNEWIFLDHFDLAAPGSNPSAPADADTNRLYTDASDKRLKIKKTGGSIIELENSNIPNSGLIQITDKAKLHSALLYNDIDNTLGSHFLNIVEIATPATPAANSARIYLDNADEILKIKKSTGVVVDLETSAAGNVTLTGTETLTNKTMNVDANTFKHSTTNAAGDILKGDGTKLQRLARGTANQVLTVNAGGTDVAWAAPAAGGGNVSTTSSNTYGDFDQIFRSGRLDVMNPANTFSYSITGSAIVANRALTIPLLSADDTLLTQGTAGAVGFVNTGVASTYSDLDQVFRSGRVKIRNPANTFSYALTGSAIVADRTWTLPLLTGNDIAVGEAHTQTLTNKTVNASSNTITDTSQAAGDLLKNNGAKFVRMARGTSLQVLRTNSGATDLEFASLDSERVGKHQANGNASTTVFNIAHGLGSNPTYAFISVAQSGSTNLTRSYTTDATNIIVTFSSAPSSGTNNVVIYWRVVA